MKKDVTTHMQRHEEVYGWMKKALVVLTAVFIIVGLYWISMRDYLLFHGLVEMYRIAVAIAITMLVLNAAPHIENGSILLIGMAYFFVGSIDMVHTLVYSGTGIFPGHTANPPTQLWIAARYMESLTLLIAPFLAKRRLKTANIIALYSGITALVFLSIFTWGVFPDCFIPGHGLTSFKKISEYVISCFLLVSIYLFYLFRRNFDWEMLVLLITSLILAVAAELAFTFYINVYGLFNLIGHLFKGVSFYLIYKAIIGIGLKRPYDSLFRALRQHKEELEQANIRLQEIDRMKSIFVASMSHELRTPLNSIIGFTGVILDGLSGEINDQQRDHLTRVSGAAKHLFAMISEIIDISKIEAGKLEPVYKEILLDELVLEVVDLQEPLAMDNGVDIQTNVPGGLKVKTDRERLFQCLGNLINNGLKFIGHDGGEVSVKAESDGRQVVISVHDTGIGIAAKDLERLFQPFERIESHLSLGAGGTGLGLYFTKKLVEEVLQGKIEVESEEGIGSTFTIKIPLNATSNETRSKGRSI